MFQEWTILSMQSKHIYSKKTK